MKGWKEYLLEDLAEILNHKRIPLSSMQRSKRQGNFPYYGASGIIDFVDDYIFDGKHVLISEDGENLKSRQTPIAFIADGKFWVNNHAHIVKGKKEYLNRLIIYYFENLDLNPYLTGAVQPKLNKATLTSIPIFLPESESEQTAIAEVLSSLDDKIDLLHRQNKTLEQLAETLFRQWFVERRPELVEGEAKEGWKVGILGDEFDFVMGQSPAGNTLNEEKAGMIFFQGRSDFGFRFPQPRIYTSDPKRIAKPLDTLVSVRAPVGDMNMAFEECCLGRGVAAFRYKLNKDFYSYTYYKMRSLMEPIKLFEDNGSVFGSIGKDDFQKLENVLPPRELIIRFQEKAKPLDDKIIANTIQIRTLTKMRETLLPKLMSGEIRVKYK